MNWHLLAYPALFAVADRWCGGGLGWRATFRGRPIYYAAPVLIALTALDGHVNDGLGWLAWRWPSWKLFGGQIDPVTPDELRGTFLRHLLILMVAVLSIASEWIGAGAVQFVACVLFAAGATALGYLNGRAKSDVNPQIEAARGALFGLLMGAVL